MEKDQREILLACLRYCRHRSSEHPEAGIHKAGVNLNEIKQTIKEVENFNPKFGTMEFTTCPHKEGYYYFNFWRKEKFYCPDCKQHFEGKFMRVLLK